MNTLQLPPTDASDDIFSYFDTKSCQAYAVLVYDVIAKASKRGEELGTIEIKAALGDKYSERYALLDVIDFLGTVDSRQKGSRQVFSVRERYIQNINFKGHWRPDTDEEKKAAKLIPSLGVVR